MGVAFAAAAAVDAESGGEGEEGGVGDNVRYNTFKVGNRSFPCTSGSGRQQDLRLLNLIGG